MPELIVATAAFVVALLGTGLARSVALSRGLLDMPTPRGSHSLATPRGGGIAIVVPVLAVACWLLSGGGLEQPMAMGLLVGGASMAVIGLLDDIHRLSVALRLAVQFIAVGGALWVVGGMSAIWIGGVSFQFGWTGHVFAFLACLWFVNLYNFMDGIDGFAAGEAVFIGTASAWLLAETGGPAGLILLWTALAGACGGFLVWNWAPAKIFMGDTGSAFLGFVIAILLAYSAHTTELSIWTAGILTSPFLADATVTLLRRLARGERVHLPHRTHAYQLIAWRWRSHSRVSALLQLINIAIILPAAWWSVRDPAAAVWICTLALTTMAAGALAVGAGGREPRH